MNYYDQYLNLFETGCSFKVAEDFAESVPAGMFGTFFEQLINCDSPYKIAMLKVAFTNRTQQLLTWFLGRYYDETHDFEAIEVCIRRKSDVKCFVSHVGKRCDPGHIWQIIQAGDFDEVDFSYLLGEIVRSEATLSQKKQAIDFVVSTNKVQRKSFETLSRDRSVDNVNDIRNYIYQKSRQILPLVMTAEEVYHQYVLEFQAIETQRNSGVITTEDRLRLLSSRVKYVDIDEFVNLLFFNNSDVKQKMLKYFAYPNLHFLRPILGSSYEYCSRYYEETGDIEPLITFNKNNNNGLLRAIGKRCDINAITLINKELDEEGFCSVLNGLRLSSCDLASKKKMIDWLIDRGLSLRVLLERKSEFEGSAASEMNDRLFISYLEKKIAEITDLHELM